MLESYDIAVEQYRYWRREGYSVRRMVEAVKTEIPVAVDPGGMTGDDAIFWLAMVWDGYLSGEAAA